MKWNPSDHVRCPFILKEINEMFNNILFIPREQQWNKSNGEDYDLAKEKILSVLKEQKISLSKARLLFNSILIEIEDDNPITL